MILISTISDYFVLRVLLTIKLDKTFCLVSVPGPVRPADALKAFQRRRQGAYLDNPVIVADDDDNWIIVSFKVREESQVHISEVGKKLGVP